MARPLPESVDTCIIGNGPSALILSYILHGHIPYYVGHHQDELLHSKLHGRRDLLDLCPTLYEHFHSSLRYSTQALPINTLLDTLIRPNADTETSPTSLVEWRLERQRGVSHVVIGNASQSGGQWVENPVSSSWDIGTLSYADMLSLPGYSYAEHYQRRTGSPLPEFQRPSRTEVADYYASYPAAVGIASDVRTSTEVLSISRTAQGGFAVRTGSGLTRCKHLVLASGIFSHIITPPPDLAPLSKISDSQLPLLVIGSGFSAADVIISAPPHRKIIHIFRWDPESRPSPLKGCHQQAYPAYAGVYRQMKLAAMNSAGAKHGSTAVSPLTTRKRNPFFNQRDWSTIYEGLPNAKISSAYTENDGVAHVNIETASGETLDRDVGGFAYVVGRRGSLNYLDPELREEVVGSIPPPINGGTVDSGLPHLVISGKTLRPRARADLELAPDVYVIGSLTGDSLVRHAFGGCVYVAGRIMGQPKSCPPTPRFQGQDVEVQSNGIAHEDLHLDRSRRERS